MDKPLKVRLVSSLLRSSFQCSSIFAPSVVLWIAFSNSCRKEYQLWGAFAVVPIKLRVVFCAYKFNGVMFEIERLTLFAS